MNDKGEKMISPFVNVDRPSWDEYFVVPEVAHNSSVNATTLFTPFHLSYRIDAVTIPTHLVSSPSTAANELLRSLK